MTTPRRAAAAVALLAVLAACGGGPTITDEPRAVRELDPIPLAIEMPETWTVSVVAAGSPSPDCVVSETWIEADDDVRYILQATPAGCDVSNPRPRNGRAGVWVDEVDAGPDARPVDTPLGPGFTFEAIYTACTNDCRDTVWPAVVVPLPPGGAYRAYTVRGPTDRDVDDLLEFVSAMRPSEG